jgi:hypothetical protein
LKARPSSIIICMWMIFHLKRLEIPAWIGAGYKPRTTQLGWYLRVKLFVDEAGLY